MKDIIIRIKEKTVKVEHRQVKVYNGITAENKWYNVSDYFIPEDKKIDFGMLADKICRATVRKVSVKTYTEGEKTYENKKLLLAGIELANAEEIAKYEETEMRMDEQTLADL